MPSPARMYAAPASQKCHPATTIFFMGSIHSKRKKEGGKFKNFKDFNGASKYIPENNFSCLVGFFGPQMVFVIFQCVMMTIL
jgi:hypothetical protein